MEVYYKKKILKKKLLMPHNIKIINKKLSVCDSLRGRVLFDNFLKKSNFLGFTRGLDFKQNLYFIGQSINRNGSRYNFLDNSISADPGIIIFDNKTRFNKLIMLNSNITDIHSIIVKKFKIVKNKSHKLINNKIGSIT